jgi:hypothetical protein
MNIRPFQAPETASEQVTLYVAADKSVKKNTCVFFLFNKNTCAFLFNGL